MKTIIGDFISLIVGNTEEDFEPAKNQYFMLYMMVIAIILFGTISILVW